MLLRIIGVADSMGENSDEVVGCANGLTILSVRKIVSIGRVKGLDIVYVIDTLKNSRG